MSFYAHPFHRRQAPAYGYPFATTATPAQVHAHASPAPSFNFFTAPPTHTHQAGYDTDIDAEEAAALAHLRSIQQRREAAQASARREAAMQARVAAQREAAYIAAVERERAREEAIRRVVEGRRRQQEALAARARAVAAQREAIAAHHELLMARRERAIEVAKQREEELLQRRNACARRCAGGCARKEQKEESKNEWKEVNDVLASLFGINLVDHAAESTAKPAKEKAEAAPVEVKAEPAEVERKEVKTEDKPAAAATDKADNESGSVTLDFNDILSRVLGVSLEPAQEGDKPTDGADALTAKLNDFLGHFGLEFDTTDFGHADKTASSSSSSAPASAPAATATEAAAPAPATAKDVPVQGKGKAVAEGEKTVRPAEVPTTAEPAVPTSTAFDKLRDISHELHLATESFTFPSKLAFADTPNADATPALLFNKGNSGYHAQAHKLLQLLLAADGISSGGDREVRKQRKAVVKAIEGAIEQLEHRRDAVWDEVREKREQGVEASDDESVSSWNSTEPEHIEHVAEGDVKVEVKPAEDVEQEKKADGEEEKVEKAEQAGPAEPTYAEATATDAGAEEVKGFEVPAEAKESKADHPAKEDEFELL